MQDHPTLQTVAGSWGSFLLKVKLKEYKFCFWNDCWEVLLCFSASIPYKGYSVWVQNSISCHLTGCSWILFPAQQGSNKMPDLYFVGIRSVLSVPAPLSAPARDDCTLRVLTSLAEPGTCQPGPHPPGHKQGRSGDRNEVQRRDHTRFSEEVRLVIGGKTGLRWSQEHSNPGLPESSDHRQVVTRQDHRHEAVPRSNGEVSLGLGQWGTWPGTGMSRLRPRVKHDNLSSAAVPAQRVGQPLSFLLAFSWKALQGWPRCPRVGLCHTKLD